VVVVTALAAAGMVAVAGPAPAGSTTPDAVFDEVGSHTFVVPADVCAITVHARGAQGGNAGGRGGSAIYTFGVTPLDTLQVNVGGQGADSAGTAGGVGGFNGGGSGGATGSGTGGGGGGGASDVRRGDLGLGDRVVVAGGGGGGGGAAVNGGSGGGLDGFDGGGSFPGEGGMQMAPGAGGAGASPGIFGVGGAGVSAGGGGGGGWFGGGGGGVVSGGGGGSGFTPDGSGMANGLRDADGLVEISYVPGFCEPGPPRPPFQPDATRETPRLGNGVYDNGSAAFQTQFASVKPRFGSTLDVYVQNDGATTDDIRLTGLGSSPGFLVRYQQLVAPDGSKPKNYITEQVIGGGFLLEDLAAGGEAKVRILVKVAVNAPIGSQVNLPLKATSVGDATKSDTARLVVKVVAP
jgi:hypothetical protein